ncbi:hypothetical protein KHC33_12740 [Methanospirillum sp. J.3.6.1-F.2.7.3]|uniref:Uncharacterized protein n=1 Tax=Methanospirillum purgamenti TaxID=2834276 RepID=A0A8E7AVR0_9EURY|nr:MULTISPECIES: hypothetical protein [Methanospirillum]MDX8551224.1 hypothetical protein [Methanospirillum hungatei]QVV88190.1 hypothetical protein KHC33_12740 [Methanospirillum sp. J.3.6.1-F.2.7.3]
MSRADFIRQTCEILYAPGQVVEVRAFRKHGISSGYFTDYAKLAEKVQILDNDPEYSGIYITLNEINPDLLARRANRIEMRLGLSDKTTSDDDIITRRWFPIDIDPKRLSGISSTDMEHELAAGKANRIRKFLSERGWPDPIVADSGNGAHLLYRISLPNDVESLFLVKNCLLVLSAFFSDDESDVDTSVSNAARIWKLYGTVSRKGDSTNERPHRRSEILFVPDDLRIVQPDLLISLSSLLSPAPMEERSAEKKKKGTAAPDLGSWLHIHGISFREKEFSGGRLFIFDECPFSSAHKDGAYAIQFENGAIFAGCHHNSCGGGIQRWQELRHRFEGPRSGKKRDYEEHLRQIARDRAQAKAKYYGDRPEVSHRIEEADSPVEMTKHTETALEILKTTSPVEYILDSFAKDHEGDTVLVQCLIMSFASRSVVNSNGLHVLVTGESGKGKSHAFDTMIRHIPPHSRLDGRMSDKALFYVEDLRAGTAICLDDVSLSETMQETLKGVTTSFQKPFVYRTVNKDRKGQVCIIPERCVWWVAKMEGTGDDQVWNRMLTCWIDDSREQDEKVLARELACAECLPDDAAITTDEVLICQQIWELLSPVYVVIPYARNIRFSSSTNRRNPGMLLDLIKSIACLHQFQRERVETDGFTVIYANIDDFEYASRMYAALNGESGGQITKLTRSESALIKVFRSGKQEWTVAELSKVTGTAEQTIRKQICGYNSYGKSYSGLLEKCPAISFLDRTSVDDEGRTRRRCMCFVWDDEVYQNWISGSGCWLDTSHTSDKNQDTDPDGDDGPESGKAGAELQGTGSSALSGEVDVNAESENTPDNKINFFNSPLGRENECVYGRPMPDGSHTSADCAPAQESSEESSTQVSPVISESALKIAGREVCTSPHLPDDFPPDTREHSMLLLSAVDPEGFALLPGVRAGPCDVCGGKWVLYTEKISARMKEEGVVSHVICQRCYSKAVARVSLSYVTLPGMVNVSGMIRADKDYGRCKICGHGGVSWYDHETKTGICDLCYAREQGRMRV